MATKAETEKLTELAIGQAQMMTELAGVKIQTTALYKAVITGNGQPSLVEKVRTHDKWIECRDLEKKALEESAKEDAKERREITWKFVLELLGKIVYPIAVAAIAVWLGLSI